MVVQQQRSKVFDTLFERYEGPAFAVRLWDGWQWFSPQCGEPACTIVFNSESALQAMAVSPGEVTLGEAFLSKEIDVEGDLFSVFDVAEHIFACPRGQRQRVMDVVGAVFVGIGYRLRHGSTHSVERDRAAISYHYDQPPEFYRPWLGTTMAYSCGYFESSADSVDTAQINKLELICRKLRLQPGERFLDIGCGWGGLILHAAAHHDVYAQGITISKEQQTTAAHRIEEARLTQSCEATRLDYRKAPEQFAPFDKIASVGMFEHVGLKNLPLYFATARKMLKPGGVFLNHGIARSQFQGNRGNSFLHRSIVPFLRETLMFHRPRNSSFIDKYVFPDGELVTIAQALRAAEGAGFEVRDVEDLREHYEMTLRGWVQGLERNRDALLKLVSETTYRIWLLYMAGSAAAFRRGDLELYQTLLSKPDHGKSGLPLRREDWYQTPAGDREHAFS
ncbi:MAG: class I SAM-dependent methyltransferase [Acidobacteriaceae bacterium]